MHLPPLRRLPAALAIAAAALAAPACSSPAAGGDVRALPALERERPVPSAPRITDWMWPFGHVEESAGSRASGFRPLGRSVETDDGSRLEILYPLWRSVERDGAVSRRLFPVLWHDAMPVDGGVDRDTALLPLLFWGSEPGQGGYFLLFPLGGTLRGKLLAEETTFVLFPLYAGTRDGKWRGTHLLWPLVHWGSDGERRSALRAWPFWGESTKEGVYERRTVLWPVVHWATEGMDTEHPVSGWLVWPLLGHESSSSGFSSWTVLWPFFSWADGPRSRERSLPFPFWRSRTEWKDADRAEVLSDLAWYWPFHGRYDRPGEERSRFWLWPLVWWSEVEGGNAVEESFGVMPLWRRVDRTPRGGGPGDGWWKLWPLASGRERADGGGEWSALSPIPWFRWEEFDANWGVFFELARVRRDPDGSRATDLLFSLVRVRSGPRGERHRIPLLWNAENGDAGSSWNLLEGLLGGETGADGRSSLRLLWFLRIPASGGNQRR